MSNGDSFRQDQEQPLFPDIHSGEPRSAEALPERAPLPLLSASTWPAESELSMTSSLVISRHAPDLSMWVPVGGSGDAQAGRTDSGEEAVSYQVSAIRRRAIGCEHSTTGTRPSDGDSSEVAARLVAELPRTAPGLRPRVRVGLS